MYFGDGLTQVYQLEKLPDWLPQLPIEKEVAKTKSISWSDRLTENPIHHTFQKYKYIYEYFLKNEITKLEVFLKFKTEEFDGFNTEPRYTYIDEVLIQQTNDTTKSELIILQDNHFDIPEINAQYPEKYRVSDILWNLDNSLFISKFKIIKNEDKRAFLQNKVKPEKIFEFIATEKDWMPIPIDDEIYSKLQKIFSNDSIGLSPAEKLKVSDSARLVYYKEYRTEYLT